MNSLIVWSKTLLTTYPYLPKAVEAYDEKIKRYPFTNTALSQDALTTCRALQRMTDHKNALINASIIVETVLNLLPKRERSFIEAKYIQHQSVDKAGKELGISRATAFRRHAECVATFSNYLSNVGFDAEYFKEAFESHPFLGHAYEILCEDEHNVGKIPLN